MIRQYLVEEDGVLVVNKAECLLISEFKALFDRDKGSKKDAKGRNQKVACGELRYIYYYNDPRSDYYNAPENLSLDVVMELSELPSNWSVDKTFEKAIEKYKKLQNLSSAGSAYFAAESALFDRGQDIRELSTVVRELKAEIRASLKELKKKEKYYTAEELLHVANLMSQVNGMLKTQSDIDTIINRLPKLTTTIKDLREQYAQEDNESTMVVGGGELGNREA